jgi:hypothetical protein
MGMWNVDDWEIVRRDILLLREELSEKILLLNGCLEEKTLLLKEDRDLSENTI